MILLTPPYSLLFTIICIASVFSYGQPAVIHAGETVNILEISERITCGPEPSEEVLKTLAGSGVRTLVSVDGQKPDLELAERHGMTYIHLPIGYDGVPAEVQASLKLLLEKHPGKIFFHCHHGKHRGPAAAAIAARLTGDFSPEAAERFLHKAGTSPDYSGLWRDVRGFSGVCPDTQPRPLLPISPVDPMVEEMNRLDEAFDDFTARFSEQESSSSEARTLPELAMLIEEALRESRREVEEKPKLWPEGLGAAFDASLDSAAILRKSLDPADPSRDRIKNALAAVKQDCRSCHRKFRN